MGHYASTFYLLDIENMKYVEKLWSSNIEICIDVIFFILVSINLADNNILEIIASLIDVFDTKSHEDLVSKSLR